MSNRKTLSKRLRFEVLKRDNFCCQYCSAKPPKVPLEIDHILPVSKGGDNSIENLITACFDCNRGKSNNELTCITKSTEERIERMKLAQAQYKQYKELVKKKMKSMQNDVNAVEDVYNACFDGWVLTDRFKLSVKKFIEELGVEEVLDAMETACYKIYDKNKALKYFCGVCWTKIRENE